MDKLKLIDTMTLTTGPKNVDFKKGTFIWQPKFLDFTNITCIGQKPASKRDKFRIELEVDGNQIEGICDYNTARILNIISDSLSLVMKEVKDVIDKQKEELVLDE